jgi:hypothetical protein
MSAMTIPYTVKTGNFSWTNYLPATRSPRMWYLKATMPDWKGRRQAHGAAPASVSMCAGPSP